MLVLLTDGRLVMGRGESGAGRLAPDSFVVARADQILDLIASVLEGQGIAWPDGELQR
jgi:hypothetical protein